MELGELQYVDLVKLDKVDKKVLSSLMLEGRSSFSDIARKIHVSKHRVINRVKQLEENGVINYYQTYVNVLKLHVNLAFLYIKTKGTQLSAEEYLNNIAKIQFIVSSIEILGDYNVLIAFYYLTEEQKDKILDSILNSDVIRDFKIFNVNKIHFTLFDLGQERIKELNPIISSKEITIKIDKKDIEILYLLSKDYRCSLVTIANKLGMTREAINFRLKKLIKGGYIGKFQPAINIFSLGYQCYILRLKLFKRANKKKIINFIANTFLCNALHELSGDWNIIAFLHFPNVESFRKFEQEFIKIHKNDIYDYSFDILKLQTKLDWFPEELAHLLMKQMSGQE